jgi:uncharacterized protein DUF5317
MLVLGVAMLVALVVPLLTHGSYKRLLGTKIRWGWLLAAGLAIQIALEFASPPRRYWHNVGFGLLVASYVLVLAFCARNLVLRGMSIVLIGIACNALVIVLNQGMPVKFPPEWRDQTWAQATVKHHPQQPGEKLLILSDIIILRHPFDDVMSYGDLILAVGLCDVFYNASRDPQRRRKTPVRALRANSTQVNIATSSENGSSTASNSAHGAPESLWAGRAGEH